MDHQHRNHGGHPHENDISEERTKRLPAVDLTSDVPRSERPTVHMKMDDTMRISPSLQGMLGGMRRKIRNMLLIVMGLHAGPDTHMEGHTPLHTAPRALAAKPVSVPHPTEQTYELFPPMTVGTYSPWLEEARATFDRIYSTRHGSAFFIAPDGGLLKEIPVTKEMRSNLSKLQQLSGKAHEKAYGEFLTQYGMSLEADFMQSHGKFDEILTASQTKNSSGVERRKQAVRLFEQGLKSKTIEEERVDKDTLWDILDADGRRLLVDMSAGMFGVESGFNPNVEKGISGIMPNTAERLGMEPEDVFDMEKAVVKTTEIFKKTYETLSKPGGPVEIIERYGLPDSRFLVYALYDAWHAGDGNVRALCRHLLAEYPTAASLPADIRKNLNSGELYMFMSHRGDSGLGKYGPDSRNYVPQVASVTQMFAREDDKNTREMEIAQTEHAAKSHKKIELAERKK